MQPIEKTWLRGVDLNPARWCSPFGFTLVRRPNPSRHRRQWHLVEATFGRMDPDCRRPADYESHCRVSVDRVGVRLLLAFSGQV